MREPWQGIEQLGDGGDLVRLAVDLALTEHQSLIARPGTDQMQRAVIVAAAAGTPDGLAVDRHHLALDLTRQGLCPSRKTALKRVRVDQHEDPPERIVRGNTVRQGQKGLQPSLLAAPVKRDVLPAFRAGDDRAYRDYENVDQPMIALACHPRIGEPVEARRQIFDHAARLPSPRTRNGRHHPQSATGPTFMREPWTKPRTGTVRAVLQRPDIRAEPRNQRIAPLDLYYRRGPSGATRSGFRVQRERGPG